MWEEIAASSVKHRILWHGKPTMRTGTSLSSVDIPCSICCRSACRRPTESSIPWYPPLSMRSNAYRCTRRTPAHASVTQVPLIVETHPDALASNLCSCHFQVRPIYRWPPLGSSASLPLHHLLHQGSDGLDVPDPPLPLPGRPACSNGAECLLRLSLYVLPVAVLPNKAVCSSGASPFVTPSPSPLSRTGRCDGVLLALVLRCDEYHIACRDTFRESGDEMFGLSAKGLSSISSPHISSASVGAIMPFFRRARVERRRSLLRAVGVREMVKLLPLALP